MSPFALYDPPAEGLFFGEIRDLTFEVLPEGRSRWLFWVVDEARRVSAPVAVSTPSAYRHCSPNSDFWAVWRQVEESDPNKWEGHSICVGTAAAPKSGRMYWRPYFVEDTE